MSPSCLPVDTSVPENGHLCPLLCLSREVLTFLDLGPDELGFLSPLCLPTSSLGAPGGSAAVSPGLSFHLIPPLRTHPSSSTIGEMGPFHRLDTANEKPCPIPSLLAPCCVILIQGFTRSHPHSKVLTWSPQVAERPPQQNSERH